MQIGERFLAGFPDSAEKQAAQKLLSVVKTFRELVAKSSDEDDLYFQLYSQVREGLSGRNIDNAEIAELTTVVEKYEVRHQYVFDFIRGIKLEYQADEFIDFAELSTCAYLNSSSVLACIVKMLSQASRVDLDFEQESAVLSLGVVDYLVQQLTRTVGQLESKKYFVPFLEVKDRGLDLMNQVEPIDESLWKDLVQFQCKRLLEKIDAASSLGKLSSSRLKRQLHLLAITNQMLIKQIASGPGPHASRSH